MDLLILLSQISLFGNLKTFCPRRTNKNTLVFQILQAPLMNRRLPIPSIPSIPFSSKKKKNLLKILTLLLQGGAGIRNSILKHCERCFTFACCNLLSTNMFIHIFQN